MTHILVQHFVSHSHSHLHLIMARTLVSVRFLVICLVVGVQFILVFSSSIFVFSGKHA
jgi:hypothetical protein